MHHNKYINQIKSLLLSHHHSTSALVSEILMSVLQTVQKQQFTYGQTVQKNKQFTYGQTVQKKQQTIYMWTDSAKKTALEHLQCSRQCKKTTTIYIWTVHIYICVTPPGPHCHNSSERVSNPGFRCGRRAL